MKINKYFFILFLLFLLFLFLLLIYYYYLHNNNIEKFKDFYIYEDLINKSSVEEEEEERHIIHNNIRDTIRDTIDDNIIEEENFEKSPPNINEIILNNPIPLTYQQTPFPLNINISYNSQNSVNKVQNSDYDRDYDNNNTNSNKKNNSRVQQNNNNNDLVNKNDFYIPPSSNETPKPLSYYKNKNFKQNTVSPLMINTPWSEYKSGDDIEEQLYGL
jgi:hypothetical protein